jgi:hypothetical protein
VRVSATCEKIIIRIFHYSGLETIGRDIKHNLLFSAVAPRGDNYCK